MQFKYSYLRTSSCITRKYFLYTNENLLFWQPVSTKEFRIIDTWPDSLIVWLSSSQLSGNSNSQMVTRHIVQFMICIDKGRTKKKEKKTTISWKTVTQCITRVVLFVTLSMICPFFHENHGVKTTERKLYERIINQFKN